MNKLLVSALKLALRTVFLCVLILSCLVVITPVRDEYRPVQSLSRGSRLRNLKRMIESRRNTPATEIGKNHDRVHEAFSPILDMAHGGTVVVLCDSQPAALGTAIAPNRVISKASELSGRITCRVPGEGKVRARILATEKSCDLALLELPGANLTPVTFAPTTTPAIGTWIVNAGGRSRHPLSVGIVSAKQRFIERDAALLGIFMDQSPNGPQVLRVMDGSAAERIGLLEGDIVTHLAGARIATRQQLIEGIKTYSPGEKVELDLLRGGESLHLSAPLSRMDDVMAAEQGFDDHLGGPLSVRRSGFPEIIQHDGILPSHQCGGPTYDLDGQVMGINIARSGRVSTYALPSALVQRKLAELGWKTLSFANSHSH